MCFDYFLTVARTHSLAIYRGTSIVFGAVIGRKGLESGKFSGGILANLVREVFSILPFIFGLCSLLSATAFHSIAELAERDILTALQFLVKCACDSQSKGEKLYKRFWSLSQIWGKRKQMYSIVELTFQILTGKDPPALKVTWCCFFKAHL